MIWARPPHSPSKDVCPTSTGHPLPDNVLIFIDTAIRRLSIWHRVLPDDAPNTYCGCPRHLPLMISTSEQFPNVRCACSGNMPQAFAAAPRKFFILRSVFTSSLRTRESALEGRLCREPVDLLETLLDGIRPTLHKEMLRRSVNIECLSRATG